MSTEIQVSNQAAPVAFNFFDPVQFETMQRISKMFAMSELVPDMYKVGGEITLEKATANCMIAISLAQRMQADPLMVMQQLIIIYGRPSWSSKFLIATVNTCGRFSTLKYKFTNLGKIGKIKITDYVWDATSRKKVAKQIEFDGTEIDNIECVAYATERGSNEVLESSEVSIKMAIEEGWYTKNGSKWRTMPKKMLTYRAASFWTNEYAPEISMGMRTEEEIHDTIDTDYEDVTNKGVDARVQDEIKNKANNIVLPDDEPEKNENKPASGITPNTDFDKAENKQPETPAAEESKKNEANTVEKAKADNPPAGEQMNVFKDTKGPSFN